MLNVQEIRMKPRNPFPRLLLLCRNFRLRLTARLIIYQAFIEGQLDVPKHLARPVHDLYFQSGTRGVSGAHALESVERIHVGMKPGAILFSFFHTKDAGAQAPFYRYNIASKDTLEMQPATPYKLQRVFNNRHVENLFRDFNSIKFFLGRDNIREVLVIR